MSGLRLENICKTFGNKKVLHEVSLNIKDGELMSLIGPSGCGKTTVLNIISGVLAADGGRVFFNNKDLSEMSMEKRGAALVDQDILLFPHMTVAENIGYGLRVRKVNSEVRQRRIGELLHLIHMGEYGRRYPHELSGGQQQRVAVARALAINPQVLLLDEPFSRLDISLRENMRQFVREIHEQVGITTVLVSHDFQDTLAMSDRICILIEGKVHQVDTPHAVFRRPSNKKVAEYLGYRNILHGFIRDGVYHTDLGMLPVVPAMMLPSEGEAWALIRPELVSICRDEESNFSGIVNDINFAGGISYFRIEVKGVVLSGAMTRCPEVHKGETVPVKIDFHELAFLAQE